MRVLLVEDEPELADVLADGLRREGYAVEVARDGAAALSSLAAADVDLMILDRDLPVLSGDAVCRALRDQGHPVRILMLTAAGTLDDRVAGLDLGADDYLPKPFELAILLARIRGLLRRREWLRGPTEPARAPAPPATAAEVLEFAGHRLDLRALELHANGRAYRLTVMEADLLAYLVRHAGQVVSRKAILEDVWDLREDTDTRAIDNFIVRLRRYLEADPARPSLILTVRGVGYRLQL